CSSRRTQGGGVELVVPQTAVRQTIERRRWNRSSQGAGCAKARVVSHDEQDIRSAIGRSHSLGEVRLRFASFATNHTFERWLWNRENSGTARWTYTLVLLSQGRMACHREYHGNRTSHDQLR